MFIQRKAEDVAEAEIGRENHLILRLRPFEDRFVRRPARSDIPDIFGLESFGTKPPRKRTREILIDEKARAYLTARTCSSLKARAA
jgi:hypothetical protein